MENLAANSIPSVLHDLSQKEIPFPEVVDNSMLSTMRACEGKFYYGFLENISPVGTSVHLHAGGAFAHGMEHTRKAFYVQHKSPEEALGIGVTELLKYYGDYECPPESPKSASRMAEALVYYFDTFGFDTDYVQPWTDGDNTGIEFSFSFPLPVPHPTTGHPILYSGRFDMLGQHRNGSLFVVDEKTASQLGASWNNQWELDSQFTGYCYGARFYGKPVAGALIRGIGILKTKFSHAEAIVYRPQWQLDRWHRQVCRDVQRAIEIWKGGFAEVNWKLDKSACGAYGGCSNKVLCRTPDPDQWKDVHFEPRVWHPMLREERIAELVGEKDV